ncbi:phosphomannomutase [Rhizobium wuzhouense]|uniref:Phosphomannomutase n=1 Tax=Rhizobium wuzhouense TaxID=1986026 RepID=A0ABX5NRF7_9HYPH|nr:phosphomannomutase [Rhizobium wuzhouense]PYB73923.1 phosphomannomutase [Rhizobium wuzhouense]
MDAVSSLAHPSPTSTYPAQGAGPTALPEGLKFGTSGLRGLVTELVGLPSRAYALGFVRHALSLAPQTRQVLVGRDLRSSSPEISQDCRAAIQHAGLMAVDCGAVPTPALALEAIRRGCPAIMVTGSHIPDDRNGLKFYLPQGEISKADEMAIAAQVALLDDPALENLAQGEIIGDGQAASINAAYIGRYVDVFGSRSLKGRRVAVYQHSSVARDLLVDLLRALGAEVEPVGRAARFIPVDTEAHEPELVAYIAEVALAGRFDAVVSTDGDADRPLVADETGAILRGDVVGLLAAKLLGFQTIVTPVTSGSVIERSGITADVVRTRVGSPFVIAAMEAAALSGKTGIIGFEANGGTLLGSDGIWQGRALSRLPTRDAVLPILAGLLLVAQSGRPLSAIVGDLPVGHAMADRLKDVASAQSQDFLGRLSQDEAFAQTYFDPVGSIRSVDRLDGIRFDLKDGAVVHYRASGNAPELRCYVEAQTKARASDLLAWGLEAARIQLDSKRHLPIQR